MSASPKKTAGRLRKMAAASFEAIPEAKEMGADRAQWAENAKADRVNALIAGGILAQSKDQLYHSFRDVVARHGPDLLIELIDHLGSTLKGARGLAEACAAARARLFILLAMYGVDGVVK